MKTKNTLTFLIVASLASTIVGCTATLQGLQLTEAVKYLSQAESTGSRVAQGLDGDWFADQTGIESVRGKQIVFGSLPGKNVSIIIRNKDTGLVVFEYKSERDRVVETLLRMIGGIEGGKQGFDLQVYDRVREDLRDAIEAAVSRADPFITAKQGSYAAQQASIAASYSQPKQATLQDRIIEMLLIKAAKDLGINESGANEQGGNGGGTADISRPPESPR